MMITISILAAACGAIPVSQAVETPLYTGWRTTLLQHDKQESFQYGCPYDWGASVMYDEEASVYRMWWCRLGGDKAKRFSRQAALEDGSTEPFFYPDYGDRIYYAESRDGKNWNISGPDYSGASEDYSPESAGPMRVIGPAESAEEFYHVGRPCVVKVDGLFYMYYEAPSDCVIQRDKEGKRIGALEYQNQVMMAVSKDGRTWTKQPDNAAPIPVIPAPASNKTPGHYRYGLGQPSVYYKDKRFVMHSMDSCTGPGDFMVRLEADNPYFKNAVRFEIALPGLEGIPAGAVSRHAQTQIRYLDGVEYLIRPAYGTGRLGLLASSDKIFNPDSRADSPADVFPQITCPDPRDGAYKERLFPTFLTDAHGRIRIENDCAVVFYSSGKGFKDAADTWELCRTEILKDDLLRTESVQRAARDDINEPYVMKIPRITPEADFSRLPKFFSSDSEYDAFTNEYFMRQLSVDKRGVYLGGGPILGATDPMWVLEWDWWFFPWIDRGAMGAFRQSGDSSDVIRTTFLHVPVDKHGYAWGSRLHTEPNDLTLSYAPLYGWPWPKYDRNYTVTEPTGWEFNSLDDGMRDKWTAEDITLAPGYPDYALAGHISGDTPAMISPVFNTDAFQTPIIELDVSYSTDGASDARNYVKGMKLYWETEDAPGFSEDRCVTADFSSLPPAAFPEYYAKLVSNASARYPLYFPMHLHPEWGRGGKRMTRLKLAPAGPGAQNVYVAVHYIRASYDTRLTTTNATLINGTASFYLWSGDDAFLAMQLPRMRRALMFLSYHLNGKQERLINQSWMVGKDGLGNEVGHGLYGSYWDLLPSGVYDIESNINYYYALRMMAAVERVAAEKGLADEKESVIGPDNKTEIFYDETPESLETQAAEVKKAIDRTFWVKETGRFAKNLDINGRLHDYGFLHFNVLAAAFGVGEPEQKDSILTWLNGREIAGDTATGADIYRWRFTPRTTTRRNDDWYYWAWIHDRKLNPDNPAYAWGNQMQDGGGVSFTSLFDLMLRCSVGRQDEIDRAFQRTKDIQAWFRDVKAAGGEGREFYRAYYDGHPERGLQQSPKPGGIGLDREFLGDGSLGALFPAYAFLGLRCEEERMLDIAPAIPSALQYAGVDNVYFRGSHLRIEASRKYVSLKGSRLEGDRNVSIRVRFRNASESSQIKADGAVLASERIDDALIARVPLSTERIELLTPQQ